MRVIRLLSSKMQTNSFSCLICIEMYHFGPGWEAGRSLNLFLSCPQSLSLNREKERGEPSYTEAQVTFLFNFSFQIQPGAMNRGREDSPPLAEVTRGVKYSGRGEGGRCCLKICFCGAWCVLQAASFRFSHFTAQLNLHKNVLRWPRGYDDVFCCSKQLHFCVITSCGGI